MAAWTEEAESKAGSATAEQPPYQLTMVQLPSLDHPRSSRFRTIRAQPSPVDLRRGEGPVHLRHTYSLGMARWSEQSTAWREPDCVRTRRTAQRRTSRDGPDGSSAHKSITQGRPLRRPRRGRRPPSMDACVDLWSAKPLDSEGIGRGMSLLCAWRYSSSPGACAGLLLVCLQSINKSNIPRSLGWYFPLAVIIQRLAHFLHAAECNRSVG
jgi:hypothetical protein